MEAHFSLQQYVSGINSPLSIGMQNHKIYLKHLSLILKIKFNTANLLFMRNTIMIDDIIIQLFWFWWTLLNLEISERFFKINTGVRFRLVINSEGKLRNKLRNKEKADKGQIMRNPFWVQCTCIYAHIVKSKVQISLRNFSVNALETMCIRALKAGVGYIRKSKPQFWHFLFCTQAVKISRSSWGLSLMWLAYLSSFWKWLTPVISSVAMCFVLLGILQSLSIIRN